jgi:hypothetical protein
MRSVVITSPDQTASTEAINSIDAAGQAAIDPHAQKTTGTEFGIVLIGYSYTSTNKIHIETWRLPGLALPRMQELLAARGLRQRLRSCASGAESHGPAGNTIQSCNGALPNSSNGLDTGQQPGENAGRGDGSNGDGGGDASLYRGPSIAQLNQKSAFYFACPMAKHNPERYEHVHGKCTFPPGLLEFKRLK